MTGFTRPDLLADTTWLAEHLEDPNLRIVDCDHPDGYRRAHIPGAVALPAHHYLKETERSYDASWYEWGNREDLPLER